MQITWTNCAEKMPPYDHSVAVMVRLIGDKDIICSESKSVNRLNVDDGYEWTEYTKEKWEELNAK